MSTPLSFYFIFKCLLPDICPEPFISHFDDDFIVVGEAFQSVPHSCRQFLIYLLLHIFYMNSMLVNFQRSQVKPHEMNYRP